MTTDPVAVRDAATVILIRDPASDPSILMGQRGKGAVFLPNKMVFPGGALDPGDAMVPLARGLPDVCRRKLAETDGPTPESLAAAAIRELWEETGAILGQAGHWDRPPRDWAGFAAAGYRPDASALRFVFRAVTPPGRPRRFDARFFLTDAADLASDPDAIPDATDELSHLRWIPVEEAATLDLAFITRIVLAEITAKLPDLSAPDRVPFVRNDDLRSDVVWI